MEQLSALLDGELAPELERTVRARVESCTSCREKYQVLVEMQGVLRGSELSYGAPDELTGRIRTAIAAESQRPAAPRAWPRLLAAGIVVAAASSALTYAGVERSHRMPAAEAAVVASHVRSMQSGHLTDVTSNNQHNVKPWFAGKVDVSPSVPRLDSLGFVLVGGRIDSLAGRMVAVVTYTRRLHVIDVYSSSTIDAGPSAPVERAVSGYNVISWRAEGIEQRAVSDLNLTELRTFVDKLIAAH